jgi:AmiR/NasT family two-component response regulator
LYDPFKSALISFPVFDLNKPRFTRFQKKQDEIKQDKAVKRRQKQIEKAKKLLEENKLIGK